MKKGIAAIMLEVLRETGECGIYFGHLPALEECAQRCGFVREMHPLEGHYRIMAAVRKSRLFEHSGYLPAHDCRGRQRRLAYFVPAST